MQETVNVLTCKEFVLSLSLSVFAFAIGGQQFCKSNTFESNKSRKPVH